MQAPKREAALLNFSPVSSGCFFPALSKKTVPLRSRKDFDHALSQLGSADAVCISFPLYVDGLPSHLAEFLSLAEEYCKARSLRFRLYAIANNGFIEGQQNRTALRILESWCLHSGAVWSGGIGIGGGVMLRVLGIVYPVLIALSIVQIAVSFLTAGSVPPDMLYTLAIQAGSWLFFNFGVLFCLARLSAAVRKRKTVKSRYNPCAASILPVCSDCRSVYDSILSVLRPVPVRTFKTGRLFS